MTLTTCIVGIDSSRPSWPFGTQQDAMNTVHTGMKKTEWVPNVNGMQREEAHNEAVKEGGE